MTTFKLELTPEQIEFLRQALNTDNLAVPVKLSRVAGEVYTKVMECAACESTPVSS